MTPASLQRTAILIIAVAVIGLTQQLRAQENAASAIASRMAENSEKLRTYTFKQTAQVYFKGELKKTMVSQVHFDSEGKRVAVPLQVTPAEDTEQRRGRIGRRIVEQKKEEMKDYIERLTGLWDSTCLRRPTGLRRPYPEPNSLRGRERLRPLSPTI
jgi:hypothetical protein